MAATIDTIQKVGSQSWYFSWSGTSPYRPYLQGAPVIADDGDFSTTGTELIFQTTSSVEPPALEVLDADDTTDAASVINSPRAVLQWRGTTDADLYVVEEFSSSAWTPRLVVQEVGLGYYSHQTLPLADETEHLWRVVSMDNEEYEGEPLPYTFDMVANPNPPELTYTITTSSSTGILTISS